MSIWIVHFNSVTYKITLHRWCHCKCNDTTIMGWNWYVVPSTQTRFESAHTRTRSISLIPRENKSPNSISKLKILEKSSWRRSAWSRGTDKMSLCWRCISCRSCPISRLLIKWCRKRVPPLGLGALSLALGLVLYITCRNPWTSNLEEKNRGIVKFVFDHAIIRMIISV